MTTPKMPSLATADGENRAKFNPADSQLIMPLLLNAARAKGVDLNNPEATEMFLKDTLSGSRPTTGWLHDGGPFTMVEGELISGVISGGSELSRWLPQRLVDYKFENVKHLEFIAPDNFDGSQSYRQWLSGLSVSDCDFGPSAVWSGFEYTMSGATWSFSSPVLKTEDFGMKTYENDPIYVQRGDQLGNVLEDDADWATARALFLMEAHNDYNVALGDSSNSLFEMDGIDTIVQQGYVQSKIQGGGVAHWADPVIVNAAGTFNLATILKLVRGVVRKIRNRALMRRWTIAPMDMVIWMPAAMWVYLAEAQASGNGVSYTTGQFIGQMNYADFNAELSRISSGGLGYGFLDVDGKPVPVIADPNIGRNVVGDPSGTPYSAVAGDIKVLVRRANGMTLLEQQYLDWSKFQTPAEDRGQTFTLMNGFLRGGWKMTNNECFQYYLKAGGRITSYYQPLQGAVNNVLVKTLLDNENEAGAFWAQDFFAADPMKGNKIGGGVAVLHAWNG